MSAEVVVSLGVIVACIALVIWDIREDRRKHRAWQRQWDAASPEERERMDAHRRAYETFMNAIC